MLAEVRKIGTMKSLFTAGYEGLDIESFIQNLLANRIQTVVDVRELPLSRKKGFSKNSFKEHLALAGINYSHASELGCPKPIRNQYKLDSDWSAYSRRFFAYLKTQTDALALLTKLANKQTVCLVCFEANYQECHRTYVARAAHDLGAPRVMHLQAKTALLDPLSRLVA